MSMKHGSSLLQRQTALLFDIIFKKTYWPLIKEQSNREEAGNVICYFGHHTGFARIICLRVR